MADAHKNLAKSTVATAPSPATTGTSLVVDSGHGARFPTPPFNATIQPATGEADPSNAEIVRVTGISTDTFTIVREQEGTTARTVVVGDKIAATITAKTLTDVEIVYNVKAYGATGDGTTEDATTVQAAIDAANTAGGGTVVFKKGTYKISTALTLYANIHVHFEPGAVIDATGMADSSVVFTAAGTETGAVNLTANATKGDASLTVAAGGEAGFSAGDFVKIGSTARWTPNATLDASMDQEIGEINQVLSTASGSITLRWPIVDSYATADTAFIAELSMLDNIKVSGRGRVNGKGTGTSSKCFLFDRCIHVRVSDVRIDNFDVKSVELKDVVNAEIDKISVYGGSSAASTFYGVSFNHACQDCAVTNSFFRDCRHAITCGGDTSRSGINRRISYINCKSVDATASAFDSHAGSEDLTVHLCTAISPAGNGIQIRSPAATITNNTIIRPAAAQSGVLLKNQSDRATRYLVQGNRIESPPNRGVAYIDPTETALDATTAGQTVDYVLIDGNTVSSPGNEGIAATNAETGFQLTNITISNNIIRSGQHSSGRAILVNRCDHVTVSGNICTDLGSTTDGIRLANSNYILCNNNLLEWGSAPTAEFGIQGVSTTFVNVNGNTVRRGTRGASVDNNCTNWTIGTNEFSTCTSAISLGTGTGHATFFNPGNSDTLAAAQADQETGTSTAVYVTPGRQHFHPSAAKFWVTATGNSTTILASYNMTSWADTGPGDADGTIATDFSSANWCGAASVMITGGSAWDATFTAGCGFDARAAGTFGVLCSKMQDGGTAAAALVDPTTWDVVGFGDHA